MKILVCIKQVPGSAQVEIDRQTGTLKRAGVPAKMNPFDLYAIEAALRIRGMAPAGSSITVLSMGPPQCEAVVRESFAMGADSGAILTDRAFGGADVLMTSFTLCQGVKALGPFDLIVCGKQTTDGDTAQVGPELAEWLGIPHVSCVCAIDGVEADSISVTADLPDRKVAQRVPYPCLVTVEKGIFEPRLPSYKLRKATAEREVAKLGLKDLADSDPRHYGLNGSPTQVKKIFPPPSGAEKTMLEGDAAAQAAQLADMLEKRNFLR
ncbi:MAG: electron transfer flavoprotein subunit beta/FixA family protein [Kiritimatiellae bacterium]|nr:electron transfer flavoprotein subunit beta/FixA family protein [Kiritimatiellia bacterium]